MTRAAVRNLFTEHEDHLTAEMPELVAVGYINARRRDGRGEKADTRLVVTANNVTPVPRGGSLDEFALGDMFRFRTH